MGHSRILVTLSFALTCLPSRALAQELQRVAAFQPSVQLNFWDDNTGTGGGLRQHAGVNSKRMEEVAVEVLREHRIPVLTDGAIDIPNAAFLSIGIDLRRTKDAPESYVYAVSISTKQPAVLRTGVATSFATFWEVGPALGMATESALPATIERHVRALARMLAEQHREANRR